MYRTIQAVALLALVFSMAARAKQGDPFIGSWKLNVTKSKAGGSQSSRRVDRFESYGKNGLKYTSTDVDQNGNTSQVTWAAKPDGKFYPMKGSPRWDATTLQRIDRFTIEMNQSKAGKLGGNVRRTVSTDGKTMTYNGGAGTLFFDKQ